MSFRSSQPLPGVENICIHEPWKLAVAPFQVSPRTYYAAGQTWVGVYLIDTGDGLLLIDTAISESLYLLIDSIYRLGFSPQDIKNILLSHAHWDHIGGAAALKELTGAKIWMSEEDARFYRECPEETMQLTKDGHCQWFEPDCFYDEKKPVIQGEVSIRTMLTPGHTPGCTSFFWKEAVKGGNRDYLVGMHGGVGANTMSDEYYASSRYLKPELRARFIQDREKIRQIPVDICLPSHPNQIEIMDRRGTYTDETQPYADPDVWKCFIDQRVSIAEKLQ